MLAQFRKYRWLFSIVSGLMLLALAAGCGQKPDTAAQSPPVIGILDTAKAIKGHPQYPQTEALQKEINTILAQAKLEQNKANQKQAEQLIATSEMDMDSLAKAMEQQYQARMTGKQNELNERLNTKAAALRSDINTKLDAYVKELDEKYQAQIFNLQVKLKTLQLKPEEQEAIKKELDNIQAERMNKIAARQTELSNELKAQMDAEQEAARKELAAYGQTLQQETKARLDQRNKDLSTKVKSSISKLEAGGTGQDNPAAGEKRQQLTVLQESIVQDINQTAAKVAQSRGLETILADVKIYTHAVDITEDVLREIKK